MKMMGSRLKDIVSELLKKEKRSASWLSSEMGMTPDGLRLSLVNESIKYSSVVRLCGILGVRASLLFGEQPPQAVVEGSQDKRSLPVVRDDKQGNDDRQLVKLLKEQIKDKQLIIDLLIKQVKTSECGDTEINSA